MRGLGWCLLVAVMVSGCASQEYGQCAAPADNLQVLFKAKNTAHPFSHSFCVVCNTELEEADYATWAEEMGGSGDVGDVEGLEPCLYVYGDGQNIDSLEMCQSLVCDGGATYNDMVGKSQGNIDVDPILDPISGITQEWLLTEPEAAIGQPAALAMEGSQPLVAGAL